jgi:hypothetical protein
MAKSLLILILAAFLTILGKPQSSFQVTFSSPLNEYFGSMIEDGTGNFLAVGEQRSYNQFDTSKGIIWKMTHNGDTLTKTFTFGDSASAFNHIFINNAGSYTIIGGLSIPPDYNTSCLLILNLDSNLNVIDKHIIKSSLYKGFNFSRIIRSNTALYGLGTAKDLNDIINPSIVKLNNAFEIVDIKTYPFYNGTGLFLGEFRDAIFSPDSNQIWTFSELFTPDDLSTCDMMIVDTSLNFVSIKPIPSGVYPHFGDFFGTVTAKRVTDTTFLVAGSYWHQYYPSASQRDIGFIEYDSTLTPTPLHTMGVIDTVDYGGFNKTFDFVNSDSIYYTGTKRFASGFFPQQVSWIYAGIFNREYELYYEKFYGGDAHYWVASIMRTSDGGSLISGNRYDYHTQNSERDVFFLKLTPEGLITGKRENQQCPYLPFAIYPNPGADILHLDMVLREAQFTLFNLSGMQLKNALIQEGENQIDCCSLSPGCYIVRVTLPGGEIFTKKWIKQ